MTLSDYTIKQVKDDVEFSGVYVCAKCSRKQHSRVSELKRGLSEVWRKTTKVEVGPSGVTYEKAAG